MGLLKKNLTFTIVIVVCLLVFGAGAYLAFAESQKIDSAKQQISSAESQLKNMRFADPAPTQGNVEASQENVEELAAELKKIRQDLEQGSRITTSTDGIGVMAGIQQFISEYRLKAANHTDEDGEDAEISVAADFGFGFEQYVDEATPYEDAKVVALLDKQRQILSYLLNQLYDADPESIVAVKREVRELQPASSGNNRNSSASGFQINSAISARVPGAIDTLAFSLSFTGYTESLRDFLNSLSKFEMPIVVRSVEVKRAAGQSAAPAATQANNLESIFGAFPGGGESEEQAPEETKKLVISENISTFTVVLEFIEIVLPVETTEDNV